MSLDLGQRFATAYLEMLAGILERGEPLTHPSPRNIAWALRDIPTLVAEVERLRAALEVAKDALHKNALTWLTLEPELQTPYTDDPRWTPWTRFARRGWEAAKRGHEAAREALELMEGGDG